MSTPNSHIRRLVEYHKGPIAFAAKMGGELRRQQVEAWLQRGYFSPFRLDDIRPLLRGSGVSLSQLQEDVVKNKPRSKPGPKKRAPVAPPAAICTDKTEPANPGRRRYDGLPVEEDLREVHPPLAHALLDRRSGAERRQKAAVERRRR